MKRSGLIKQCLLGLIVVGLVISGSLPAMAQGGQLKFSETLLNAKDADFEDAFGSSVAISEDTVVVGAPRTSFTQRGSGSAYVFVGSGINWIQQAKLTASDAATLDAFGTSVAISGDTVLCGAPGDDDAGSFSGSAYVFVGSGTNWMQQAKLTADDAAAGHTFGISVAISGDAAVIGASAIQVPSGDRDSSAYLFVRTDLTWSQEATFPAIGSRLYDTPVAIGGDTVLIGTPSFELVHVIVPFVPGDPIQAVGPAVQRPLSEFLDIQGTFCFPNGLGGCRIFNPPLPNYLDWRDADRNRIAAIDYAGLAARYVFENFGLDFGTEISGSVTERPLADGRVLVTVILHTTNAFTWVVSGNDTQNSPVIFGNRIAEVLAGAEPALGDCTLKIEVFNQFSGSPLWDLVQLLGFGLGGGGLGLRSLTFTASALGELHPAFGVPEGSPGVATVTMMNLQMNGPGPTAPVANVLVNGGKKGF